MSQSIDDLRQAQAGTGPSGLAQSSDLDWIIEGCMALDEDGTIELGVTETSMTDRQTPNFFSGHQGGKDQSQHHPAGASHRAVALAMTPIHAIKDVFLRHRDSLSQASKSYTMQQMEILRSICNMVIKICTLYRIDPLSKVLKRHQQFIGDASKFLKTSQQEFAGKAHVCSTTEERYYNLVYTYQSVALLPIVAPGGK